MPVRKKTLKKQLATATSALLEPGEQMLTGFFASSEAKRFPVLRFIFTVFAHGGSWEEYHFVVVTDRRVLLLKASAVNASPKGIEWAGPRRSVQVSGTNSRWIGASLRLRSHGGMTQDLLVSPFWREEIRAFLRELLLTG